MKKLIKIIVILIILIAGIIGTVLWQIDTIAKTSIEKGGTYALGVATTVDNISIRLLRGSVKVDQLKIANPQGFKSSQLMTNKLFGLNIESGSVFSDTIEVPLIELDGLDVYLEKNKEGQNNFSIILENLEKFKSTDDKKPEEEKDETEGKKFIVKKVVLTNITAHVEMPLIGTKSFKIDRIELNDITNDSEGGIDMADLIARVMPAIMGNVVTMGKELGQVPAELAGQLAGELTNVAALLGDNAGQMLGQATDQASKLADSVLKEGGKALEDVGKEAGKAVEELGKGIDDLGKSILGGDKKSDDNTEEKKGLLDGLFGGDKDK